MTAADLCDVAYTVQVEQLERWIVGERQVAATLMAAGADGVEMPSLSEARDAFDSALDEPFAFSVEDPERGELLEALGLRRAG